MLRAVTDDEAARSPSNLAAPGNVDDFFTPSRSGCGPSLGAVDEHTLRMLDELAARRDVLHGVIARHGGVRLWVFGSVARREESADNDIDFIVEFEPGRSLFDLMDVEHDLSELLGRTVDVISLGGLKDRDDQIRREMLPV